MLRIQTMGVFLILLFLLSSCSTTDGGTEARGGGTPMKSEPTETPLYYGVGVGDTSLGAMNTAKGAATRKAAEDLLGLAVTMAKKAELDAFFGDIKNFNLYVYPDTTQTLSSGQDAEGFVYSLGVRINLKALGDSLVSKLILGGQITGQAGAILTLKDQAPPAGSLASPEKPAPPKKPVAESSPEDESSASSPPAGTPEERTFIETYLSEMTYMVYYDEESPVDPFLKKAAVVSANKYLNQNNMSYVDLDQIESLKKDGELVYEEETGEGVSLIQWVAHKLNADIYIEINLNANGRSEGSRHYGSATVTLNNYEASTADGRGAASYQTNPPAFSQVSQEDALNNAVTSAVYKAMPQALNTAERETRKALRKGLKYSLVMLNTRDSRLIRDFERKLKRKVRSLRKLSFSAEQTKYEVYLLADIVALEDIVYDVADSMPALEGLALVMQQRSSLTFDSGL